MTDTNATPDQPSEPLAAASIVQSEYPDTAAGVLKRQRDTLLAQAQQNRSWATAARENADKQDADAAALEQQASQLDTAIAALG